MSMNPTVEAYITALNTHSTGTFQGQGIVSRSVAKRVAENLGYNCPNWFINDKQNRWKLADRGMGFVIPSLEDAVKACPNGMLGAAKRGRQSGSPIVRQSKPRAPKAVAASVALAQPAKVDVSSLVSDDKANTDIQVAVSKALGVDVMLGSSDNIPYVPQVAKTYVPWGHFTDLQTLVESQHFLPTMIVGPSGNGKTDMCEQVCAVLGREYVRVNITSQTDEDDLLGGFRLVNGETKFALGPIPLAMLRGAVVNLDEIDLGGSALMCLQPVLEGKPLYLKKIGRYIAPAPGFNVVATANTKGRGDDGKYAHTTIMNEAMLERFAVMLEQGWADAATERKIVGNVLKQHGKYDGTLVKHMVEFAAVTRNNFEQQICNDQIATRRLLHMARVFCALGSVESALKHTLSRFDADTANGFKNLWSAIHENPNAVASPSGEAVAVEPKTDVPF